MTDFTLDTAAIAIPFQTASTGSRTSGFADALWARRLDVWTGDAGHAAEDRQPSRLARAPSTSSRRTCRGCARSPMPITPGRRSPTSCCSAWAARASRRKCCGASSASRRDVPRFRVLDSVDPDAVRDAMAQRRDVAVRPREQVGLDDRAERHGRRSGAAASRRRRRRLGLAVRRDHRRRHGAPQRAQADSASARSSSTRPTSAAATPRCRSSAWCRPR